MPVAAQESHDFVPLSSWNGNEALGTSHLDECARRLAEELRDANCMTNGGIPVRASFERNIAVIEEAYKQSVAWASERDVYSPVAEWLLDNFYVVREQMRDIRTHLPPKFFRELPKLPDGRARIHVVARELICHCDCALDEDLIVRFIDAFQENADLTIGETWAFPVMLRLVLIENLRALCGQLLEEYRLELDVQVMLELWKSERRFELPDNAMSLSTPILLNLHEKLKEQQSPDALESFDRQLQRMGWNLPDLRKIEQFRVAANQVSMGNIITSMRLLNTLNWIDFFERTNRCERVLRRDPSGHYEKMDFASRNSYRTSIEQLSKHAKASEKEIAKCALLFAEKQVATNRSTTEQVEQIDLVRQHIGYWLVDDGRRQVELAIDYKPGLTDRLRQLAKRNTYASYFGGLSLFTLLLMSAIWWAMSAAALSWPMVVVLSLLAVVPATELALRLFNEVITNFLPVNLLPKIDFRMGVDQRFPTFVVIPTMLGSKRDAVILLAKLENHFLTNNDPTFSFALLTDFVDSSEQSSERDRELLEFACSGLRELNQRYGKSQSSPFFLFHRERFWNPSENVWMGWERKRGKLMEFGDLLSGSSTTSYKKIEGDLSRLAAFTDSGKRPFIITLDSDTLLPRGTAAKLVGTLAHPLNVPFIDAVTRIVTRGYTVIQPRVSIHLADQNRTRYLSTHAVQPGLDPYCTAASDVYQDLFGEGSFTGKGIYDLRAFQTTLKGRFRENQILSHDLIEGCYSRVGLASDIEVFDGYPSRYDADAKRMYRWVRGDWQISRWLFSRVPTEHGFEANSLSVLSRWKIFDNLRRSLVAPSLMLLMIVGWLAAPSAGWLWTALGFASIFSSTVLQAITGLFGWSSDLKWSDQLSVYLERVRKSAEQAFYGAAFLPHKALQMFDAIVRTLTRLTVTHRKLLQWETAAAVEHRLGKKKWAHLQQLAICSVIAVALIVLLPRTALAAASPWIGIWFFAPLIAQLISTNWKPVQQNFPIIDESWLRQVVSGTWGFFERYVNAEGNWLPPDNVQYFLRETVAFRISPTNEGLFLVSGLVARRFGFAGLHWLADIWEKNLASWNSLELLNGHHYNWYDTAHLRALRPLYVSTVDSGNLLACYLTLGEGISELIEQPLFSKTRYEGAFTSLRWLDQRIRAEMIAGEHSKPAQALLERCLTVVAELQAKIHWEKDNFTNLRAFLQSISCAAEDLKSLASQLETTDSVNAASVKDSLAVVVYRFRALNEDANQLMPWLDAVANAEGVIANSDAQNSSNSAVAARLIKLISPQSSLRELAQLQNTWKIKELSSAGRLSQADVELEELIASSTAAASAVMKRFLAIKSQCEVAGMKMDFQFLYNANRKLMSIGFNSDLGKLDQGHYDLLCSECRLSSFLAIAKGDVETEHWFRLGRQATAIHGRYTLLSWGGTMFEFLMPQLFQKSYKGSLIDESCETAISRQIEYGNQTGKPWGISESAFSAISANTDYQYKSFGVPGLGLKRGLSKDLVVSPYSSALALPIQPQASLANLQRLSEPCLGRWGFYDAIDYTPSRLRRKQTSVVVLNYMAHHQGMILLALANALDDFQIVKWFHANPYVRANELLLQERVPELIATEVPAAEALEPIQSTRVDNTFVSRQIKGVYSTAPKVLLLSNGEFSSMLTHAGGGYVQTKESQITRWRSDSTRDHWGSFIYLNDRQSGNVWSAAYHPTRVMPDRYEALFAVDKGEIHSRHGDIETALEVVVSPEHNAEVRQLRIMNHGDHRRTIEITSYAEVVLASAAADLAHPAFQKLFVETEFIEQSSTIVARRRPRDATQSPVFALHTLAVPEAFARSVDFETSREVFLGRGRTLEFPQAMVDPALGKTQGAVLDPIFALRCVVTIEPNESVAIGFTTAVASTRQQALSLADSFHDFRGVQRAIELAWAFAQIELRHLNLSAKQVQLYQQLGGLALFPEGAIRADSARIAANHQSQRALWHFGISGDVPMIVLRVTDAQEIEIVKELIDAHNFLISRNLTIDLILINDYPGAYVDALQEQMQILINNQQAAPQAAARRFLIRGAQLSPADHTLLDAVASVLLHGKNGSLAQQIEKSAIRNRDSVVFSTALLPMHHAPQPASQPVPLKSALVDTNQDFQFDNGVGRVVDDGKSFEIYDETPTPWSNVIANPQFGTLITERGGGFTWFGNSRENKLTSWSNDPVLDSPSESIYVSDLESGMKWSPLLSLGKDAERTTVHGQGFSRFHTRCDDVQAETLVTVHCEKPLKVVRLTLKNLSNRTRTLSVVYYAETVLGVAREQTLLHQVSSFDITRKALLMRNGYHPEFQNQVVFLSSVGGASLSWTGDRRSFLGRDGSAMQPAGLGQSLNQRVGGGLDPCMALQGSVEIQAGATKELFYLLGAGANDAEVIQLLEELQDVDQINSVIADSLAQWDKILQPLSVQTPNPAFDVLVNRWLPYQILSCRIWGRSAFYQAGGAYGFRDQLQDVMAFVYTKPELAREHILRAAARQYVEGDVQHWWHPPGGKGTRTRFSDDFLFLPYVTLHYLKATGDESILNERVHFVTSPTLMTDEHGRREQERYEQPAISESSATLLEHCRRALAHGMRYGSHGLPLMGCGDWNDGMNKVGEQGQGESVWVAWFQIVIFDAFAKLLRTSGDDVTAIEYEAISAKLRQAVEDNAWDGEWYRRAYFDDGSPLGSHECQECQIDSLTQSWAVIANGSTPRSRQAFESAVERLVKTDTNIVLLFDPPFNESAIDPGYIKGYLPGVRENGGQYTHAAVWMIQAATLLGKGDLAMQLFDLLNPLNHTRTREAVERYKVEPYVLAADVYSNQQHKGRGGWTWYTGSASWMYRIAIESQLGIQITKDQLAINPSVPADWMEFRFTFRRGNTTWKVLAKRRNDAEIGSTLQLIEDGQEHQIVLGYD